jgi:hypothetical protein
LTSLRVRLDLADIDRIASFLVSHAIVRWLADDEVHASYDVPWCTRSGSRCSRGAFDLAVTRASSVVQPFHRLQRRHQDG